MSESESIKFFIEEFSENEKKTCAYALTAKMVRYPIAITASIYSTILFICIAVVYTGMFENTKPSPYDWIIPSSTESKLFHVGCTKEVKGTLEIEYISLNV
jgi:hypothetical protein